MNLSREIEVEQIKARKRALFDQNALHILNGQAMYDEFKDKRVMGDADYTPFNEAMCVNTTTTPIFGKAFIQMRAAGHHESEENYRNKVIKPLNKLFKKSYDYIVLWFGEDMFCQMNLLTLLAYLEHSQYKGKVFFNCFKEDEFKVSQMELPLGHYYSVYEDVLIHHRKPTHELLPVMSQAIDIFLDMQTMNNPVVNYILKYKHLSTSELLKRLFKVFPTVGYGDSQYMALINKIK
ncbi:hypothetical protein JOD43_002394 [Pullulanibacillus pueri]|uniref:AraC family transcriptional regulator n=1 Tax=Pullulanibacillus pueri TaxID=1437324 RepID=A0A8J3ELR9_9BACL|nr:AraC family transcriptional regulator [Pullulanibacillus pueri]MBM7682221.1 hypothetical protein [Pullulanibacillus pueri]GGH80504.1 AraC family transcriptional regulator [Pullulanibacillus pueri]